MASIEDQENLLNSLTNLNDLELSAETLEYLRNPTTPEAAKLDALIDLMADTKKSIDVTNEKLDAYHAEQVQNQQKIEVWHEEDSHFEKKNFRVAVATLIAAITTILLTLGLSEPGQELLSKVL